MKKTKRTKQTASKPGAANGTTLVSFVLDQTGSMDIVRDATIRGFNEYLDGLRRDEEKFNYRFTLTLFNTTLIEIRHRDAKPTKVPHLVHETYVPDALTPLYDAVGRTIRDLERQVQPMSPKPAVLMIIMTDGQENSSREWTRQSIFNLITEKESVGWNFLYLGSNQDAWLESSQVGIAGTSVAAFAGSPGGTVSAYHLATNATTSYAQSAGGQCVNTPNLGVIGAEELDEEDKKNVQIRKK